MHRIPTSILYITFFILFFVSGCRQHSSQNSKHRIVVFAAASLTDVLGAWEERFESTYPTYDVDVNLAATSLLARQIDQGAEADLFFSANREWMYYLEKRGYIIPPILEPLGNKLVVVGSTGTTDIRSFAERPEDYRLAIADPDHVPAGIYAKQALTCLGVWEDLSDHVIPTLDVRAALLSVQEGATELGVVYASDVRSATNVKTLFAPAETCQPNITYTVVRLYNGVNKDGSSLLLEYILDSERKDMWETFGFIPLLLPEPTGAN